ncbi:MAG TPA: proton-conducting transporter membrane subunit [Acidobacteriota bacterium]|jgi:multicomponent Na+:H+ antiporter subunit D|nr:proton-conducting transporter membrane subunit [Acidobacteriota bacterium]HRR55769.1 proton-conducting transporter membrane subunit [Acidobacteriota bacterium]HRV07420.1 proton-conducting transporter membrane subunit [Acidobacteriota bacterium]
MWHVIPLFIALPLAGAFLLPVLGRGRRWVSDGVSLAVTVSLCLGSFWSLTKLQESAVWVYTVGGWKPPFGISLVLDGLSAFMLVTVNLVAATVVLYALRYLDAFTGRWQFHCLFLLMVAGMNGVVLTGDLFNLFVTLEIAAVASYGLVAFGTERHELEAAFKYAVMGSIGSLFILLGLVLLYSYTSTLNMADMAAYLQARESGSLKGIVLGFFILGFGLKAALVPFHAWLPDAHPSAPAPISAMLSGVLIKSLGVYALCRVIFCVLGFTPAISEILIGLGILSMLIGVVLAVGQWDFKRLLAYHSISQVGYIILGVGLGTPLGLAAGLFHLFNHSIFKSLLFLDSGVVEQATGTRDLRRLGGLNHRLPVTGGTTLAASMAIAGIPPFNGFWSKLLVILAAIQAEHYWAAFWAVVVSVLTLASFTKVLKYAFLGDLPERLRNVHEAPVSMRTALVVLALICVVGGVLWLPELRSWFLDPAVGVLGAGPAGMAESLVRYWP